MPQTQSDVCRIVAMTCNDQEFSIDRFWGGLLPVDPMDYVTRATLRLEQLDPGRLCRFHETNNIITHPVVCIVQGSYLLIVYYS